MFKIMWTTVALAAIAPGQTEVDLRTQSKSVDFSAATSTKPVATGTALPATCGADQMFFLSNAPEGENVYGCTAGRCNPAGVEGEAAPSPSRVPVRWWLSISRDKPASSMVRSVTPVR